jgi:Flp pilus assembly protein TadG
MLERSHHQGLKMQRRQDQQARGERGSVAVVVAFSMVMIVGMAALAMDFGRAYHARTQMQAAIDAAALAGVKSLDSTATGISTAQSIIPLYAAKNSWSYTGTTGFYTSVSSSDITFGSWNSNTRTFTAISNPSSNPTAVTAIKIDRQSTGSRESVPTTFGRIFNKTSISVGATTIAVGGGPGAACSFPLAVSSCAVQNISSGQVNCGGSVTIQGNGAQGGWTNFTTGTASDSYVDGVITGGSGCSDAVADNSVIHADQGLQGNSLNDIQSILQQHRQAGTPYVVTFAVVQNNACSSNEYPGNYPIVGFAQGEITGVITNGNNKGITMNIKCGGEVVGARGGGPFFGAFAEPFVGQ